MPRSTVPALLTGLCLLVGPVPDAAAQRQSTRAPDNVIAHTDLVYGNAGGRRPLRLDLYRPKRPSKKKLPVVVWIHGGGWRAKDKSEGIRFLTPLARTDRYVCVSINYRLSGEAIWPAQLHDCKAAIRWLRASAARYGIEPTRIGVWGASAGAHLAAVLGTTGDSGDPALEGRCGSPGQSTRVACVASYFAPADLTLGRDGRGARSQLLGGPLSERLDQARAASATHYVSADDPPFLHIHGTRDRVVPITQSERFDALLRKAGVESRLIRVAGADHGLRGHHESLAPRVRAFFDTHLGKPPPDPRRLRRALEDALRAGEK